MTDLPDILTQGERARLLPVLADTSREKRVASVFLAILPQIPLLAEEVFQTVGQRIGKRTVIETYTEVCLKTGESLKDRPDGLVILRNGQKTWSALLEVKIAGAKLDSEQVGRYLEAARANGVDAVITVSNEFVARADHSPVHVSKLLLKKVSLFHWSWAEIATHCEILTYKEKITDIEQAFLVEEFNRFLSHPGTGVERFSQMGPHWKDLNQAVANQEKLKRTGPEVEEAAGSWFAEVRDLELQLSREIGQRVSARIERKLADDPQERMKDCIVRLVDENVLQTAFTIPDSAANMEVCADLKRKTLTASMKIRAPLDRKSTKARVRWLLNMLKIEDPRILIRAHWPGRASFTQKDLATLMADPAALQGDNETLAPHSFEVLLVEDLGRRFSGRKTFVEDVERIVPEFYALVGQSLRAWQARPPKPIKDRLDETIDDPADLKQSEPQTVAQAAVVIEGQAIQSNV